MEIAQAFSNRNLEQCLECLTEQTFWNTPGEQYLIGRKEIEPFCKKISAYFNILTVNFQQLNLIENDRCIAINGTATFIREGKRIAFVSSCDVYEFDDKNKIVSIISYCITEQSEK